MINKPFISFDSDKLKEYCLILGFFISLFSATCFFFDPKKVELFGIEVQLPVFLAFFPLTFAFSNIIQDKFGRRVANSLILAAFMFDTLLVFGLLLLASVGDREDYRSVFADMPLIMITTWLFLGISGIFNTLFYAYLKRKEPKNIFDMLFRFFLSITAAEMLISTLSMPLMFYRHGLSGSVALTIIIEVTYKIILNAIITFIYGIFLKKSYAK
jgi:uncharacterized PurR-regulated membrane protein YhhQ (DUF165 family)